MGLPVSGWLVAKGGGGQGRREETREKGEGEKIEPRRAARSAPR